MDVHSSHSSAAIQVLSLSLICLCVLGQWLSLSIYLRWLVLPFSSLISIAIVFFLSGEAASCCFMSPHRPPHFSSLSSASMLESFYPSRSRSLAIDAKKY
ncbi:hypothetical protein ABZP36_029138 [Zizania latifolia]